MINRQYGQYKFIVKEGGTGETFIALEPCGESPERLKEWDVAFDLSEGTDYERASEIAQYLNDNLGCLSLTGGHPHFLDEESSTQH